MVQVWLAIHPRTHVLYLSAFRVHNHNPTEKILQQLQDRIPANGLHGSIGTEIEWVRNFFCYVTAHNARRLVF